jgi:hypothetical protein
MGVDHQRRTILEPMASRAHVVLQLSAPSAFGERTHGCNDARAHLTVLSRAQLIGRATATVVVELMARRRSRRVRRVRRRRAWWWKRRWTGRWWLRILVDLERADNETRDTTTIAVADVHLTAVQFLASFSLPARHEGSAVRVCLDVVQEHREEIEPIRTTNCTLVARVRCAAVHDAVWIDVVDVEVDHRQPRTARVGPSTNRNRDVGVVGNGVAGDVRHSEITSRHTDFLGILSATHRGHKRQKHANRLCPRASHTL